MHTFCAISKEFVPRKGTVGSAGFDCFASISEKILIWSGERKLIPLGFRVALNPGYYLDVRPRSGLAIKNGITVLNSPGLVDSDYRGEVCAILINHSEMSFEITPGMKVCQIVVNRDHLPENGLNYIIDGTQFDNFANDYATERGEGGLGSTGL